jgi:hypothetical protein
VGSVLLNEQRQSNLANFSLIKVPFPEFPTLEQKFIEIFKNLEIHNQVNPIQEAVKLHLSLQINESKEGNKLQKLDQLGQMNHRKRSARTANQANHNSNGNPLGSVTDQIPRNQ